MAQLFGSILDMAGNIIKGLGTPTANDHAATKKYVDDQVALASGGAIVPPGVIQMYGGATAPSGWALCQGQSVSTTGIYAALFAVIGYTFGGSGASFNLPDLQRRSPVGAQTTWPLGSNDGVIDPSTRSPFHNHTGNTGTTGSGHTHDISVGGNQTSAGGSNQQRVTSVGGSGASFADGTTKTTGSQHTHNLTGGGGYAGGDSQSPNLAVNFIIKA